MLILFDDPRARLWAPFAFTRPVGELRFGALSLRARVEEASGTACVLHLCGPELEGWDEPGAPPAGDARAVSRDGWRVVWSSRAVPSATLPGEGPATFRVDGQVVGWRVPPGDPLPDPAGLAAPGTHQAGPDLDVPGEILDWPWTLVDRNAARLADDLASRLAGDDAGPLSGVVRIGSAPLILAGDAQVEGGVIVDTRQGPVRLESGVRVEGPARLVGPLHLDRDCTVFGGTVARSSVGPVCKLRGEVDGCVLVGFSNKAHDGYLGHALLGRWVNLGALTTNSDLKNTYSTVRVALPHGEEDTGLLKVGVFLGDHVKTGIGTLLTTGGVVGAASNVFGGGTQPRSVPPFAWGGVDGMVPYQLDRFLATATTAMARRNETLTPGMRAVLTRAWARIHGSP